MRLCLRHVINLFAYFQKVLSLRRYFRTHQLMGLFAEFAFARFQSVT